MVDFNSIVKNISSKLGNKIESSDKLKEMVSNLGDKFTEKVQSGNFAEGSIFDAASKLGINSKDDLKNIFAQFKEDPKAMMSDTFSKLKDTGFFEAYQPENVAAAFEKATGNNTQGAKADGDTKQASGTNADSAPQKAKENTYSAKDINKAYRRAAKIVHPDMGGNEQMMQELNRLNDAAKDGTEESAQQFFNFIQKNNLV